MKSRNGGLVLSLVMLGLCVTWFCVSAVLWHRAPWGRLTHEITPISVNSQLPSWPEWSEAVGVHSGRDIWLVYESDGAPYPDRHTRAVVFEGGITINGIEPDLILEIIRQSGIFSVREDLIQFEAMLARGALADSDRDDSGQYLNIVFATTLLFSFCFGSAAVVLWFLRYARYRPE